MDQEIIDILNSTPRCVTRRVIKMSAFSLFNVIKHNSLGPNHTRKVDKSMTNRQEMTREDWGREIKNNNVFHSDKHKDESELEYLTRLISDIDCFYSLNNADSEKAKELFEAEKWDELYEQIREASDFVEELEVKINDYFGFLKAKQEGKIII
jgi:hypothetical protein